MSEELTPKTNPESSAQTKRHHVTREEEADRSLNHTNFGKGANLLVTALFLLTIFGVPAIQHVVEIKDNLAKRSEWKPDSGQAEPGIAPEVYSVFGLLPTTKQLAEAKGFWGYWNLLATPEAITKFEDGLKEHSVLTRAMLSPTQAFMSGVLGAGNEKAYLGQNGWLFYRPDVEYLTSEGFLEPHVLKNRSHGLNAIQPDPIKAIIDTRNQLKARAITLVLMPVPTKPMIHPEFLAGAGLANHRLQNPSYRAFLAAMEKEGIPVFDPTDTLMEAKKDGPTYLQTDTHWTPAAMAKVSERLAAFIKDKGMVPPVAETAYGNQPVEINHLGDIAEMLKLPKDQKIFQPQKVTVGQITDPEGKPWLSDPQGDVLLLGDSFSNIFSLSGMGWGTSAGLAEHLSYDLKRPVDKIVINAGGAFSSRRELQAQLSRGNDRLAGKQVVVWEFCMRDLSQGDWKILNLPQPKPKDGPSQVTEGVEFGDIIVTGQITEAGKPPTPGSVPYKDCVIALHLTNFKANVGRVSGKDILVYVWGMKDNVLVDSPYRVGQTVTLKLKKWAQAEAEFGGYNRMELDNNASLDWEAFWGVIQK